METPRINEATRNFLGAAINVGKVVMNRLSVNNDGWAGLAETVINGGEK